MAFALHWVDSGMKFLQQPCSLLSEFNLIAFLIDLLHGSCICRAGWCSGRRIWSSEDPRPVTLWTARLAAYDCAVLPSSYWLLVHRVLWKKIERNTHTCIAPYFESESEIQGHEGEWLAHCSYMNRWLFRRKSDFHAIMSNYLTATTVVHDAPTHISSNFSHLYITSIYVKCIHGDL